ncbi:hypothetical protein LTR99_011072 [Exophiala xenobiotica]|uniref:Uncharacterized protein n=1 Tax=Vermiconidia calcicola TaxID=1690605 RepID=A0AAV9PT48_9PEZI|nr:hypothetical protein LTR99_011072 [Exophiala xenobiotica]KAK5401647.1 hypothetical protein LTR06_011011 [Exophiala xenobiotica]KAK5425465.1 hypothetical protein LTR34_011073 [Exophiala xenobiotica]KAK5527594.1 hypothetical protein LTR25_011043 [Vermiconidia calcicola]
MPSSIIDFKLDSADGEPIAWITDDDWKQRIWTEIKWILIPAQYRIVFGTDRADKLLAIMAIARCVNVRPEGRQALHSLRLIVYAWVSLPYNESQKKWEAKPVIYEGPVTVRSKDGHVDKDGEAIEGKLLTWFIYGDGSGHFLFKSYGMKQLIGFTVEKLISDPKLVELLELGHEPWKPIFVRSSNGLTQECGLIEPEVVLPLVVTTGRAS